MLWNRISSIQRSLTRLAVLVMTAIPWVAVCFPAHNYHPPPVCFHTSCREQADLESTFPGLWPSHHSLLLSSSGTGSENARTFATTDKLVRVLPDQPVLKLQNSGLVSLAGIRFPKPLGDNCDSYTTPVTKLHQLVPPGTLVQVKILDANDRVPRKAIVMLVDPKSGTSNTLQGELIRRGYAKVSSRASTDLPLEEWTALEQQAAKQKVGPLYRTCTVTEEAQFEPLQYTMQTDWREDDGRPVRRKNPEFDTGTTTPPNPGDRKGCSDFRTYEDALRYYERYFPYYGDVARLDRDGDGVPCPGLPHTQDGALYRMKAPENRRGM